MRLRRRHGRRSHRRDALLHLPARRRRRGRYPRAIPPTAQGAQHQQPHLHRRPHLRHIHPRRATEPRAARRRRGTKSRGPRALHAVRPAHHRHRPKPTRRLRALRR